jgi:predicted DCC family thiol-disulfide oxidoreductase YuxK
MVRKLKEFYLTIDLRSLALYRILLAGLLIFDWFMCGSNPEAACKPSSVDVPLLVVRTAFCVGLAVYMLLLVGYRTRLVQCLAFLFFVAVLNRNVMIGKDSNSVLATTLMWSLFLPMGERFSLDAIIRAMRRGVTVTHRPAKPSESERCEPSLAAFAIVAQIGIVYYFAALSRYGDSAHERTALTWGTLVVEFAALPLILFPLLQPWLRRLAMIALVAMPFWLLLTTGVGAFPLAMIATYTLLLLPEDWELFRARPRPVTVYYDDTCGFCHRCAQLLVIADRSGNLRFIGNHDTAAFRHKLTQTELESSIVVFDDTTGERTNRSAAAVAIFRALPWPFQVFRVIAWPGVRRVSDAVYDFVALNRYRFSEWLGFTACGIDRVKEDALTQVAERSSVASAWCRVLRVAVNIIVAVIFVALVIDGYNSNVAKPLGRELIRGPRWMRLMLWPRDRYEGELK